MAKRHPPRYLRERREAVEEWSSEDIVSDAELLNRVILAKALMAYASGHAVHFRTGKEDLQITPSVARDVMRAAGRRVPAGPHQAKSVKRPGR